MIKTAYVCIFSYIILYHFIFDHNRYTIDGDKPIIIVTENGCDVPFESSMNMSNALNDTFRINFYTEYLQALDLALADGVDIRGYFAWSLLDNFEWADGYR